MVNLGQIAIVAAFMVTIYVVIVGFTGGISRERNVVSSAIWGFYSVPILLLIATASLIYAFVTNDFSVQYVAENSNRAMPRAYAWVAFYAGNAGSLLYIATAFSVMGVVAIRFLGKQRLSTLSFAVAVMGVELLFFLIVILFLANPLSRSPIVPSDGQGINPLLVHFGMFIHPPFQMLGLISVAIPFSIVMGSLLAGRAGSDEWVDQGRLWGMISWLILTIGLMLGSWWAYTILGWGGYWAWDPVENSALMPWLVMTAFVHSIMVQKRRGMFRMWNVLIMISGFTLAQLGMFINRGGPVPSVHSFAESTMGWIFLAYMGLMLFLALTLFVLRYNSLTSRHTIESLLSREVVFLCQNVLLLLIAFFTLWGTVFPIFSESFDGTTVTIGQPFFNKVNGPLMIITIFLMGIGPLLPWRKASYPTVLRSLRVPLLGVCLTIILGLFFGFQQFWALAAFGACAFVLTSVLQEWVNGTRARGRRGDYWAIAFFRVLSANRPRNGGYIVHLAVIMLALGITGSSFFSSQKDITMKPGDEGSIGRYSFEYISVDETVYIDRIERKAKFKVWSGNKLLGYYSPQRTFYPKFDISATRGAIHSSPMEDFYLVPSDFQENGQAIFRVLINPMVWWMWAAGPVFIIGTIFALSVPRKRNRKERGVLGEISRLRKAL